MATPSPDRADGLPDRTTPAQPATAKGNKRQTLVRHFRIDHELTAEDRVAYEALLLDPRQTVDSLLAWLSSRGYKMSRGAVHRHRRNFELDVKSIRHDAKVAGQFAALARAQGGPTALADAGQFRFEQMFLEQLFRMKETDERGGKEWLELARAMSSLLDNRRQVEQQRVDWQRRAAKAVDAVERAGKKKAGFNGVEIANTVRRILGVPLPGEPIPGLPSPPPPGDVEPDQDTPRSLEIANDVRRRLGYPPVGGGGGEPSEN